jgi:hypothetical protein
MSFSSATITDKAKKGTCFASAESARSYSGNLELDRSAAYRPGHTVNYICGATFAGGVTMKGRSFRHRINSWHGPGDYGWMCVTGILLVCAGCSGVSSLPSTTEPAALPASSQTTTEAADWAQIGKTIGKAGELREGVYTITLPRDDLTVRIEGMDVPTAAGIESTFCFYQCSCGKTSVIGQFVLPDYEANDVVYALQKQDILVSSMGPFLLYEKPRLMVVRFQAEGKPGPLAQAIRSALDWTGKNRMPAQKLDP